jgi:hypothetical protein
MCSYQKEMVYIADHSRDGIESESVRSVATGTDVYQNMCIECHSRDNIYLRMCIDRDRNNFSLCIYLKDNVNSS